ncbi:hypothetical protein BC828DRAFT_291359 [Blastocladiella britannica]|nr:hypothetical protein BC828DRAFT_291359 [Blastocladiella britannica]
MDFGHRTVVYIVMYYTRELFFFRTVPRVILLYLIQSQPPSPLACPPSAEPPRTCRYTREPPTTAAHRPRNPLHPGTCRCWRLGPDPHCSLGGGLYRDSGQD